MDRKSAGASPAESDPGVATANRNNPGFHSGSSSISACGCDPIATSTTISPCLVNFTALPTRLTSTGEAGPVAEEPARHVRVMRQANSKPFAPPESESARTVSATISAFEFQWSNSSFPASIFEKSRMSLMTVSSESAEEWAISKALALLRSQRRIQRQLRHPDHGVDRRADFVAHVSEEFALARLAFSATALALINCPRALALGDIEGFASEELLAARIGEWEFKDQPLPQLAIRGWDIFTNSVGLLSSRIFRSLTRISATSSGQRSKSVLPRRFSSVVGRIFQTSDSRT